jgi:hypothetical protein
LEHKKSSAKALLSLSHLHPSGGQALRLRTGKPGEARPMLFCVQPNNEPLGAPYLARFSRDVGYHDRFP